MQRAIRSFAAWLACWMLAAATGVAGTAEPASDLAHTVALMAQIGSCSSPSWSADGSRIAFVSNLSGSPQIWTVAASGGFPERVTALDDPVGFAEWSPDGEWLAFSLAPGGGMNEQIYLVRPNGTGLRRLTDGGKENNRLGGWTHDGRALMVGSNRRDGAAIDAYLYDLAAGDLRLVSQNRGTGGFVDVSRDGRWAILNRVVSRGNNDLFVVDIATGRETLLTPHTGPGNFAGAFAPDGRSVYLISDKDRDLRAFARAALDPSGRPGAIEVLAARDDAELTGFEIDPSGTRIVLSWNVAGRTEIGFFDPKSGRVRRGPVLPADIAFGFAFAPDGKRLAMTLSGSNAPADVWVLDIARGRCEQITRAPHAGVDIEALVRPELVRYAAHDGLALSGWLYRPVGGRPPYPIVLSFHGGPEGQERPGFNSTYQALLSRGIAVLAPNVRGSSGFGKRFVNLDNGALRTDAVRDIEATLRFVTGEGIAAPDRVGIMGGSYGGYMVMAGLAEYPDRFAAGANLFGVVNFETFFAHTEPWMAAISTVEYGDPATQRDLLRALSPIHKVDRVVAPTLVLHGANDTNVPVVEAEQVVENLRRRQIPVDYILFPDEGHGWRKTPNRIRSTVAITEWFERHLAQRASSR
jgi:dipeptidyl aminopeptidase/acylaminoacyl peptidase